MTNNLPSPLSAYEWRTLGPNGVGHPITPSTLGDISSLDEADRVKALVIANAELPDSSPYKITRADVAALRTAHLEFGQTNEKTDVVLTIADKLAALLPPEHSNGT